MIKIFGSVLLFFYNICNSYGGAILLFGLLVKLIMLPFQMKSKHSMMRTTMLSADTCAQSRTDSTTFLHGHLDELTYTILVENLERIHLQNLLLKVRRQE